MAFNPPLTIKVKRQRDAVYDTYTAVVTSYREGLRKLPDGLYRNNWTSDAKAAINAPLGGTSPTGTVTGSVDVIATADNITPDPDSYVGLKITAPDVRTHTPPRQRWKIVNGIYVAINGAVIPEPPTVADAYNKRIFTAAATDICSILTSATFTAATTDIITSANHGLITGELITVASTTTLPPGLVAATQYRVDVINANTFNVYTLAGALVDITGIGTGTHTWTRVDQTHGFEDGDIVGTVSEGTIPPGLDSTLRYKFISLSPSTFRLLTERGEPVNITGAGSGRHSIILIERPDGLSGNLPEGVTFYEAPYNFSVLA